MSETTHSAIHPIALLRTRSLHQALQIPSLNLIRPFNALPSCAAQSTAEYALAIFISQRVEALFQQLLPQRFQAKTNPGGNQPLPRFLPKPLLLLKNLIAATLTAGPAMAWDRINQQLILGESLRSGTENIIEGSIAQMRSHPLMAKEFLRGLPIAVLSLTIYLMIQEMNSPAAHSSEQPTGDPTEQSSRQFWAVANMAFIGFLGGLVDCTVGTGQLHGLSTTQTLARVFSKPLTPLSYGLLGAVSLGFLEFALKRVSKMITQQPI